ncbi:sulfotransferase [Streptomyces sp. NPDC051173]|uniref:sulfotransferase family protein n=1 Tax=Streptomyces sp. NPDC051173 TaxID=3155164 RepID=UPI00344FE611
MAASQRVNSAVAFIVGSGHSGSTLLGLMLGTHPSVFFAGEAQKSLLAGVPGVPEWKAYCRRCGPGCPVWGGVRPPGPGDRGLYDVLARRSGRPVVVDSSKDADWSWHQAAGLGGVVPAVLIVLARDGRAVVNSWRRKYPDRSVRDHTADWAARMRDAEALAARWHGPVCRVHYEDLATRPEPVLRRVCAALGLDFRPEMSAPWHGEHHPLSGNAGTWSLLARAAPPPGNPDRPGPDLSSAAYYADHPADVVLDLRWKREMSAAALAEFEEVGGETNVRYAR